MEEDKFITRFEDLFYSRLARLEKSAGFEITESELLGALIQLSLETTDKKLIDLVCDNEVTNKKAGD